jgi:hypothetical protein
MMPEILTESFCERCGTRYTFESAAPRKIRRLGKFKTLSQGLKTYVLSDETSMDEAMALARSDQEREATAQQLDAFHATFNFCMTCRQYTCGNCWNQAEGRCLTCAPLDEAMFQAPFPDEAPVEPIGISADAWPTADLPPLEPVAADHGGNGSGLIGADDLAAEPIAAEAFAPEAVVAEPVAAEPVASEPVASEPAPDERVAAEPVAATARDLWPAEDDDPGAHFSFLRVEPDPSEPVAAEAFVTEAAVDEATEPAFLASEPTAAQAASPAGAAVEPLPDGLEERASDLATRTSKLLGRFRPGQNIDAELEAFEAGFGEAPTASVKTEDDRAGKTAASVEVTADEAPAATSVETLLELAVQAEAIDVEPEPIAAEPEPEPVAAAPEPEPVAAAPEPEPVAAAPEPEPEPVAVAAEPEPIAAALEPEPVAVAAEPEPEPEPVSAAPEPEPVAASAAPEPEPQPTPAAVEPTRDDRVPQPTWRIFAPEPGAPGGVPPVDVPVSPPAPPAHSPFASAEPQWPTQPALEDSPSMALLAKGARQSSDALWAASSREVLAPLAPGPAVVTAAVQPCSSCGLSLSATARFCRRCGTRQG